MNTQNMRLKLYTHTMQMNERAEHRQRVEQYGFNYFFAQHDMHKILLEIRFHYPLPTVPAHSKTKQQQQPDSTRMQSNMQSFVHIRCATQQNKKEQLYQILTSTRFVYLSKSTNDTVAWLLECM